MICYIYVQNLWFACFTRLMRVGGVAGAMASMDSSLPTMSSSTAPPSEPYPNNYSPPQSCFIFYICSIYFPVLFALSPSHSQSINIYPFLLFSAILELCCTHFPRHILLLFLPAPSITPISPCLAQMLGSRVQP